MTFIAFSELQSILESFYQTVKKPMLLSSQTPFFVVHVVAHTSSPFLFIANIPLYGHAYLPWHVQFLLSLMTFSCSLPVKFLFTPQCPDQRLLP